MSKTITVSQVQSEMNGYVEENRKVVSTQIQGGLINPLSKYCKTLTKINGEYPSFHSVLGHVVQGFSNEWTELGTVQMKHKLMKSYKMKVNFGFKPSDILGSYLAKMYEEGKELIDNPISKYIIEEELIPQVSDDVDSLVISGQYDATKLDEFGFAMDGIETVVKNNLTNTDNPYYKIPVDAFTDTNIVDQITVFERNLPKKFKGKMKAIFMSENNAERYSLRYDDQYGQNNKVNGANNKTRLGKRDVIGLAGLSDDVVFAFPDKSLVELMDIVENPATITDVQKLDYKVKVFMEFTLGYDFPINEVVCVANFTDVTKGLGDADKMKLYYPKEEGVIA